jgi:cell division protein FtsL
MTNRLVQAYRQAPWRNQLQWIGVGLLVIIAFSLTAWLYLSIASRTSIAGREIQDLRSEITQTNENIANMQIQKAAVTATSIMEKRAKKLGYKEVDPDKVNYLIVPGYTGRMTLDLSSSSTSGAATGSVITSDFTQSLWDWMVQRFVEPSYSQGQ